MQREQYKLTFPMAGLGLFLLRQAAFQQICVRRNPVDVLVQVWDGFLRVTLIGGHKLRG